MNSRHLGSALLVAIVSGCTSQPEAPPLTTESVYQNESIGLKFLVPAGWSIESRAVLPAGHLEKPILLVSYAGGSEQPAMFRVLAADLAPESDLRQYVASHAVGPEQWTAQSQLNAVTINGVSANRFALTRVQGKSELRREVTAFRRRDRVYFFLVDFTPSDTASRDVVRSAVGSVTWTR